MDFREVLSQCVVLYNSHVTSDSETGKPTNLFVGEDGTRIYSDPLPNVRFSDDQDSLQAFFSKFAKELKKYTLHTKLLFKASLIPEGPLAEEANKVRRILTWGNIKTEVMTPILYLIQSYGNNVKSLLERQEDLWSKMESELSWCDFLLLCKKLDTKPIPLCWIYIACSFKNPNIQTLLRFRNYLNEFSCIKEDATLIRFLAARIYRSHTSAHERAALQLIMEEKPKADYPCIYSGSYKTDFKSKKLYKYFQVDQQSWDSGRNYVRFKSDYTLAYSPIPQPKGSVQISVTQKDARQWPAFETNDLISIGELNDSFIQVFRSTPKHMQENGMRLIRKAQEKYFIFKGDDPRRFSRFDLMVLYFLYHSTELPPKERYCVENGVPFEFNPEHATQVMGNAIRSYLEYDLLLNHYEFENLVENGEIIIWERNSLENLIGKNIPIVDPLLLTMSLLEKDIPWIESLFYMEKVHQLLIIDGEAK